MNKNDVQEKLKNTFQGAADSIKIAAQNVKKPDIKLPNQVKEIFKKKDGISEEKEDKSSPREESEIRAISTKNAIKIFYYLMAVDGEVFQSEEEKFDEIGAEIDQNFTVHKESIVSECKAQLGKVIDSGDYYDVVQEGVEEAILLRDATADSFVTPKLLVWDLLTIAYSDENYDESERRLLKYIVRKFNIDSSLFLEMENTLQTLMDIEREINWIKTTSRPYLTIEAQVNELADRRNNIFESVKDLIML